MTDPQREAEDLFASVAAMIMDRATSTAWVIMIDGTAVKSSLDFSSFAPSSSIVRTRYLPRTNRLFMETNRGDIVEVELPTLKESAPLQGRPVVYLDQRDWSQLARAMFEPERIGRDSKRDAAEHLIALARSQKVILPMSFAHLGETSKWGETDRRYNLALTLTRLSRGWQMRHPLDVWQTELHQTFSLRFKQLTLPPLDVFTLDGGAIESKKTRDHPDLAMTEFPDGIDYVRRASVYMMSYIDMVLDSEATPMTPVPEWADTFQFITNELAKSSRTSDQKRNDLRFTLLTDIQVQVAEAALLSGITVPELELWVELRPEVDLRNTKCLSLWHEVYQDKHLNPSTKWSSNDLTDMMYLTCAAGYADYVLAERSLTNYVKQAAKRLQKPINIYSRIEDLVAKLKQDGL